MISSKNDQASEYQGKNKLEHINKNQQPDDVISSKNSQVFENQGKDSLKDLINNQSLEKNYHKDVEGNNNPIDEGTKEKVLLEDTTFDKSDQKINQG